MSQLDRISKEWRAAREVISDALCKWDVQHSTVRAEQIIARLAAHDPPILLDMQQPDATGGLEKGVWFQAGCSGMWYRSHVDAGSISEVRIDGVRFVPACLDAQDEESESDEEHTGPVCFKCHQPVDHTNGTQVDAIFDKWMHDSCAAAAEREWERRREER